MSKVELSIIIVNYNTADLVVSLITSIFKSKLKTSYEIIVVDNGSNDDLLEKIKKINLGKSKKEQVKVIENEQNLGFAKANNIGIARARGEYVLLLNSDTIVKEGSIDKLVSFAKERSDCGVVVPRLLNKDDSIQASVFQFPTIWRAVSQYWFGEKGVLNKYYPLGEEPTIVPVAVMAAFLITPKARERVSRLNEKYFMYFEDFDYCRNLEKYNLKIYYLPTAEVIHFHGASGGVNENLIESAKKYHGFINYYIFTFILWSGQKFFGRR